VEIKRNGSQASAQGPAEYFTGTVRIDQPFQGTDPACVSGAIVTFEPGARTAWHTHPLGQTLIGHVRGRVGCSAREALSKKSVRET
jgi:quercetin dioxygenase-like cupin family protein